MDGEGVTWCVSKVKIRLKPVGYQGEGGSWLMHECNVYVVEGG